MGTRADVDMEVPREMRDHLDDRERVEAPQLWEVGPLPRIPQAGGARPPLRPVAEQERSPTSERRPARVNEGGKGRAGLVFLVSVEEAARALGLGRSKTYELIAADELETVHIGRAVRVPIEALEGFVARLRGTTPRVGK